MSSEVRPKDGGIYLMPSLIDVTELVPGITIYRTHRSPYFYVRVYKDNTHIKKSLGIADKAAATKEVLNNLAHYFSLETDAAQRGETLSRLMVQFIEFQRERAQIGEITESSFYTYQRTLKFLYHWLSDNGFKYLSQIKRNTLKDFATRRVRDDEIMISSANQDVTHLRSFFHWCQDEGKLSLEPNIPKLRDEPDKRLGNPPFLKEDLIKLYDEIDNLCKEAKKNRGSISKGLNRQSKDPYITTGFKYYFASLIESGMRPHEILTIKWADVTFKITRSARERSVNIIRVPMNTKRGFRITIFRGESLLAWRDAQKALVKDIKPSDYVFRGENTDISLDQDSLRRYWIDINKKLGFSYKLYSTRSHKITEMVLNDVPMPLIARNCGLSVKQIEASYLRYCAEAQASLILREKRRDDEYLDLLDKENL